MERLAVEHGWKRGVELGIGSGLLLRRFLALGIEMVGVDLGRRADRLQMQQAIAREHPHQCRLLWISTESAAQMVEDDWADFIFIDAAHSYLAVSGDIRLWKPKVKPGGWLGGHDYHPGHPGVVRAVGEAFGGRIRLHGEAIWSRA